MIHRIALPWLCTAQSIVLLLLASMNLRVLSNAASCGFYRDCLPQYSLKEVNASASRWGTTHDLTQAHLDARRSCSAQTLDVVDNIVTDLVGKTGGWCLEHENETLVELPNGQSYLLPYHHVEADSIVVGQLHKLLYRDGQHLSINDFGAGVGQFGHALKSLDPAHRYTGYDGAGNIEEYTNGFVRWFDLTIELSLPRADWVVSFEVGEHIPHMFEHMVLRNLHAHNCRGIILSWAVLGQAGHGHINTHSNAYLIQQLSGLGYRYNQGKTYSFRWDSKIEPWMHRYWWWFRDSLMVFDRIKPLDALECTAMP